jgi:hypothetical protein
MKTPKTTESGNQVLVKIATCLYRSVASNIYYGIYKRAGKQVKRSLKTTDKELAKRCFEHLREKAAQLNTKRGSNIWPAKPQEQPPISCLWQRRTLEQHRA